MLAPSQHRLDTIWGHEAVKQLVRRMILGNRLPHALMLHGPDGVGKRSLAFAIAKQILSSGIHTPEATITAPRGARFLWRVNEPTRSPDDMFGDLFGDEPDMFGGLEEEEEKAPPPPPEPKKPEPESKTKPVAETPKAPAAPPPPRPITLDIDPRVDRLVGKSYPITYENDVPQPTGFIDLNIIEPIGKSKSIKVDQVRLLQDAAWVAPMEGRYRVIIVLGADTITGNAANSLLKFLEEPASYLKLILVTDHYNRVLETIRSRCSSLLCQPLEFDDLTSRLVQDERVEAGLARVAAAFAEGRPGRALEVLSGKLLEQRKEIFNARLAIDRIGPAALPQAVNRIIEAGGSLGAGVLMLLSLARDRMVHQLAPGADGLLINRDLTGMLEESLLDPALLHEEALRLLESLKMEDHPAVPAPQIPLELALWPE